VPSPAAAAVVLPGGVRAARAQRCVTGQLQQARERVAPRAENPRRPRDRFWRKTQNDGFVSEESRVIIISNEPLTSPQKQKDGFASEGPPAS
jgi:hypothetical protein